MSQRKSYLDKIAIVAALICAVHCAAFPVFILLGLSGGLGFVDHWVIDASFIGFGVFFLYFSVVRSYFRHRQKTPILLALTGAVFFIIAITTNEATLHLLFAVGGSLWAMAHFFNLRINKQLEQ